MDDPIVITLSMDDPLRVSGLTNLTVHRTPTDLTQKNNQHPKTFLNHATHWWDGSQMYGNNLHVQVQLRSFKGIFSMKLLHI